MARTMQLSGCVNCGKPPEFRPSDNRHYPVLLVHNERGCPARFGAEIYHSTKQQAKRRWEQHVAALRAS